ncbi:Na+/alanine symporter [Microbacterium amylolyticum]|uniref:Na+/alanine symporter n=1 Tax=Microbacterium amylolyticum TaxID=936337 RepID=A0ABS4ZGD1_9MICO|nr:Na+/alanine symporter [Microbacterium amylolyticum]
MIDAVQSFLDTVTSFIWGPSLLIPLLLGTGLYLTIRLGGIQFVRLGAALRLGIFRRKDLGADGDISQFQALTTALAATAGTGNIVGVATALAIGGPGALFWMWITGLVGMASKYTEAFLGVRFRTTDEAGERNGGPQQYLERGIPNVFGKILALSFTGSAAAGGFAGSVLIAAIQLGVARGIFSNESGMGSAGIAHDR